MEKTEVVPRPEDPLGTAVRNLSRIVKRKYATYRKRWDCQHEPMELSLRRVNPILTANFGLTVRRLQAMLPKYRVMGCDARDGWFNIQVILRDDIKLSPKLKDAPRTDPQLAQMSPA